MAKKYYRFVGVELAVSMPKDRMCTEDRHLAPFQTETVEDPHNFQFEIVDKLTAPKGTASVVYPNYRIYDNTRYIGSVQNGWEAAYIRVEHQGKQHRVQLKASQFPGEVGTKTILNSIAAEHLIVQAGGFILHASYIEWEGKAILFTAPSGTGKSTQADLWHTLRNVRIINGDRAAVRMVNDEALAAGLPFAGSSQYCENRTLPMAAIVYLQQAPETTIRKLRGIEAFRRIWEGCSVNTWDGNDVELATNTVQQVIDRVPVYQLNCTPDESAVLALEQVLRKQENL